MPLTLEMPADTGADSFLPVSPLDTSAADAAAAMVETPTDDLIDPESVVDQQDQLPADQPAEVVAEANGHPAEPPAESPADQPEKKKRTRKPKADKADDEHKPADDQPIAATSAVDSPSPSSSQGDELLDEIARAETVCLRTESVVNNLREELKSAKKEYDAAVLKLRRLCRAVTLDAKRPLLHPAATSTTTPAGIAALDPTATGTATGDGRAATAVESAAAHIDPDAWRSAPLADLNLQPKLAEKLIEAGAATIGELEDLRGKISQGKGEWPKGIGKAKITMIEDAVVSWLTKNRDSAVFLSAAAASSSAPSSSPTSPAAENWESLTDDQQQEFICARAVNLDTGENNSLDSKNPNGKKQWDSGYEAYGRGLKVSECPYSPGDEQDDWIRGWLAAGKVESWPDAEEAVKPAVSATQQPLSDLDDL